MAFSKAIRLFFFYLYQSGGFFVGLLTWVALLLPFAALHAAVSDTRLVDAAKKADRAAVRALLQEGVDVNASSADGTTALLWAVDRDDFEIADMLIRAGANSKAANRYGVAPLSRASIYGDAAMIEMLLKAGADPNTALPEGETVLMTASRTGKVEAVKALLAHGADVNAKESWRGQTALMWAAAEGHADVVRALAEHGAEIEARSNGTSADNLSGYRFGEGGLTALLFAARQGKIDSARALLEAGANVNDKVRVKTSEDHGGDHPAGPVDGSSALALAVGSAHYELAAFLLEKGADPNAATHGWTALHEITRTRRPGVGDNLPAPEGSGNIDSLEMVRRLVAHGANVNAPTKPEAEDYIRRVVKTDLVASGATPFLMAARAADVELMRLLVELGADPLRANDDNTTPLLAAAGVGTQSPGEDPGTESEALEAVKLAWQLGGDVNAIDKNGETAMHGAAYKHMTSVVPFLIDKGARIEVWNQKDRYGWTPLMIAEGVQRVNNIRPSPPTANAIREAMASAKTSNADQRTAQAPQELVTLKFEFVRIEPGTFMMGCSETDTECLGDEKPAHHVRITKGFEMGTYEVTQAQWKSLMASNPSRFKGEDRPVESVSGSEVQDFLQKLNARHDGYRYRLPTEAEWEYAARAGTAGKYSGSSLDDIAWYGNNSGRSVLDTKTLWETDRANYVKRLLDNDNQTHAVGQKQANPWGLYDMEGNVMEWVQDWYDDRYYPSSALADPQGPANGQFRVARGGSWSYDSVFARVSQRFLAEPSSFNVLIGFRCVREAVP
jgi:ankyrin repeat protein/formylglycine-generating enzyme required for sulfatase activity